MESQGKEGSRKAYGNGNRDPESAYTFDVDVKPLGPDDFKFLTTQVYTVFPDGSIELHSAISSNRSGVVLPRLGYVMELPAEYNTFDYYGRGPVNNYADRKTGQFIEHHRGKVGEQDIMLPKPQSMGNREEVRWCALTNPAGRGALFIADGEMSASALPWTQQQLAQAAHPYSLPQSTATVLHLDTKVTGLGGASCGQGGPVRADRVTSDSHSFGFIIRPLNIGRAMPSVIAERAKVSPSGEKPIDFSRNATGKVTLTSPDAGREIMYAVNGTKKAVSYTEPINFRSGGTLQVWYKDNPTLKFTRTFEPILSVPLQVVFVSSEEPGSGMGRHLVDGDPSTIWHSAYGVTVTKYPHWIDFDASEEKTMKGFTFLPRQEGQNGWVKDYEIYVSQDGANWGEPIMKGQFERNADLKKVTFKQPVKARYIRLRALSEWGGQDFGSGAEFTLIAD